MFVCEADLPVSVISHSVQVTVSEVGDGEEEEGGDDSEEEENDDDDNSYISLSHDEMEEAHGAPEQQKPKVNNVSLSATQAACVHFELFLPHQMRMFDTPVSERLLDCVFFVFYFFPLSAWRAQMLLNW